MRASLLALLGITLAVPGPSRAQDRPQPPPTFRAAVDVVPVDVSVLDRNGRPVPGLAATDFSLTVDGKPRTVASAQFISVARPADPPRTPAHYSTNAGAANGRLIMLVVDAGNLAGRGREALAAARKFVRSLSPADRVALVSIPGGTPYVDFTASHDAIEAALPRAVSADPEHATPPRIGLAEAVALERNDTAGLRTLLDRECAADPTPAGRDSCLQQLSQEAGTVLGEARHRAGASTSALRTLLERLAATSSPKTIVLISGGLLLDRDTSQLAWLGPRASAAQATVYALQLEASEGDVASPTGGAPRGEDRELLREGLDMIAAATRGDVFRVASTANAAFDRLADELSGYYLLGFEPQPGDRDAKPHRIRIDVPRKDLVVRARREFSAPPAAAAKPSDTLLQALRSPLPAADVPLTLTTYVMGDSASAQLKLILAAQIDRSHDTRGRLSLAYAVLDDTGRVVASQMEPAVTTPLAAKTWMQKYVGSARVAPGAYTVRLAVADEAGRRGSVERPVSARLHAAGALQVTDVLIADNSEPPGAEGLMPSVTAEFTGSELHAYVELYSGTPAALASAAVTFEVLAAGAAAPALSAPGHFQQVDDPERRRVADATIRIDVLPPGEYVARAVITSAGQRVGEIDRPFTVAGRF